MTARPPGDALGAAEGPTRALVAAAYDAFVAIDAAGRIVEWNPSAETAFGWSRDEALGRSLVETIIPERMHAAHRKGLERFLRTGQGPWLGRVVQVSARRRDRKEFPAELTIAPLRAGTGWMFGAFLRDITERKRAEEERDRLLALARRARADAEAANRAKDEFLSVLSHELRSPLGAIRNWATLLATGRLDPEQTAHALDSIERNVVAQARLIEDLLDVSQIASGKVVLESTSVDLGAALDAAVERSRPAAEGKGIRVERVLDSGATEAMGDAARIEQMVWNLLDNAIKFSSAGGRVWLALEREGARARITVRDEGEGIAPDLLPHVFDRFRQSDSTRTRPHGGLGLGLAIVRHLVALHRGTVEAESAGRGQGARFTVRLPLARPALVREAARPAPRPGLALRGLAGAHVLLVDDDPDVRESIAAVLDASQARVTSVGSAREARHRLERERVDVLVSDVAMPGEDGHALVRTLRARGDRVPALALTAFAGPRDRARAIGAGFDAYLAKPVDPQKLVETLAGLLARAAREPGRKAARFG